MFIYLHRLPGGPTLSRLPVGPALAGLLVGLLVGLIGAACNSYDPNLGNQPFRCGDVDPRCPQDYTCVNYGAGQELCESSSGGSSGTDAGLSANCNDDSDLEPNNETSSATITPIPNQALIYDRSGLAICPRSDVDVFAFSTDISDRNLRTEIAFDSTLGTLRLEVLNNTGTTIRMGTVVADQPGVIRAEVPNLPIGDFFVQVSSAQSENNYAISLVLTGP